MKKLLILILFSITLCINSQSKKIEIIHDSLIIRNIEGLKIGKVTNFKDLNLTKILDNLQRNNNVDIFIITSFSRINGVKTINARYFYDLNKYSEDDIKRIDKLKSRSSKKENRI